MTEKNRPIDWAALQCQVDMGRAGTLTPDEARVRIAMVLGYQGGAQWARSV